MGIQQLMEKIAVAWSMEQAPLPNEDGLFWLDFEPGLKISVGEKKGNEIIFYACLTALPQKNREEFLLKLMMANLFGRETGGSVLGLDQEGENVSLRRCLPNDVTFKVFYELLEQFVNYAHVWDEEIKAESK